MQDTSAKHRVPDSLPIVLALPVYQIWHVAKYANTRDGLSAKIGAFIVFIPVIAFCSVIWGFLWCAALWALWQFVGR